MLLGQRVSILVLQMQMMRLYLLLFISAVLFFCNWGSGQFVIRLFTVVKLITFDCLLNGINIQIFQTLICLHVLLP